MSPPARAWACQRAPSTAASSARTAPWPAAAPTPPGVGVLARRAGWISWSTGEPGFDCPLCPACHVACLARTTCGCLRRQRASASEKTRQKNVGRPGLSFFFRRHCSRAPLGLCIDFVRGRVLDRAMFLSPINAHVFSRKPEPVHVDRENSPCSRDGEYGTEVKHARDTSAVVQTIRVPPLFIPRSFHAVPPYLGSTRLESVVTAGIQCSAACSVRVGLRVEGWGVWYSTDQPVKRGGCFSEASSHLLSASCPNPRTLTFAFYRCLSLSLSLSLRSPFPSLYSSGSYACGVSLLTFRR